MCSSTHISKEAFIYKVPIARGDININILAIVIFNFTLPHKTR
jgi:hypothetical protein